MVPARDDVIEYGRSKSARYRLDWFASKSGLRPGIDTKPIAFTGVAEATQYLEIRFVIVSEFADWLNVIHFRCEQLLR